jgi:hypothetical protein
LPFSRFVGGRGNAVIYLFGRFRAEVKRDAARPHGPLTNRQRRIPQQRKNEKSPD